MNDDEMLTAVRDRFAPVRMDRPAAAIMKRGSALRHRRHGRLAAGALAVSLGAGFAVPALTAGSAGPAPGAGSAASQQATLAAWTVQKHRDGSVIVTIRRPQNLAALERELARLKVPAMIVVKPAKPAPGCVSRPVPPRVVQIKRLPDAVMIEITPGKIPSRQVLWIAVASVRTPLDRAVDVLFAEVAAGDISCPH